MLQNNLTILKKQRTDLHPNQELLLKVVVQQSLAVNKLKTFRYLKSPEIMFDFGAF